MTTTLPHDDNEDIEYCTDPELIDEKFGDIVDLVIDGGIGGTEGSTVVDCTNGGAGNHTPGVRLAGRRINIEFRPQFPNLFNFFYVSLLRNTGTL